MRINAESDLLGLISARVPEGPSLEYKAMVNVDTREERRELLKDLTGMANGGGGTIVFGLSESAGQDAVPESITPLTDRGTVAMFENVVRSAVRPPLLMRLHSIEVPGGYCLIADVDQSPLGPYMVEAYGEQRFHTWANDEHCPYV